MNPDLSFLQQLVTIHSGSANARGVTRVQELLATRLRGLGFEIELLTNPDPTQVSGPMLIGKLLGEKPGYIDLVTHADTVEEGMDESSPFRLEDGGRIAVGPGALDDKGAQVMTLQALERYLASLGGKRPPLGLRWISSPSEELGSPGFHALLAELGRESRLVLGFEPALEQGSIINARRGNRWYRVRVQGRGGHSGRAHRHGVNAALDLCSKLERASRLTDYGKDTSVSIGGIRTATDAYNVICAQAEAKIDTRFSSFADRDALDAELRRILLEPAVKSEEDGAVTQTTIELADDCPPFEVNPATAVWSDQYRAILSRLEGTPISARGSGGAADCCYMNRPGLIIIDGLGPRGGRMHEREEFVEIASISSRALALAEFLVAALPKLAAETA